MKAETIGRVVTGICIVALWLLSYFVPRPATNNDVYWATMILWIAIVTLPKKS